MFVCFGSSAFAQNARITHKITKQKMPVGPAMGRDLWFTMAQNYDDQGGKWYMLYVTSPNNTTVYVESSMGRKVLPVQAYKVAAFDIPLGWEVKTSGKVEDKGIRVYSNDADITAYLMSHNPATTDGMYIVPPIGWGTDYVVAAYASLFEGFGSFVYDYPSEFSVVANQNNTLVEVTPTQDIRGDAPTKVLHPANQKFSDYLRRGQCVQYQLVQAQNADDYDMTGTIVHSNNPVGVIGASQCPNIPVDYPYCDHVCDMLPPIRTWAKTYYTAPFVNRGGGDTYLIIGSKQGQIIYYKTSTTPKRVYCVLGKQYDHYWRPDLGEATRWESDAPFMLVQYANSATWPDGSGSFGDPAMVVVNSVEQFTNRVVFMTPPSVGSQSPFTNYTNVVVNQAAANSTTFDGKRIALYPKLPIDGIYDVYRVNNVQTGSHEVKSDSGVGVYGYGYGWYESYAWTGNLGTRTFDSPDTIPPMAVTRGECFTAHVHFDDIHLKASKLNLLRVDTSYNMSYIPDANWIEGTAMDSTYYDIYVLDNTQPASITVTVIDAAGNVTTVKSDYTPQIAVIAPNAQNFGTGSTAGPATILYDSIVNLGQTDFKFDQLKLLRGNVGFHIDSADLSPLKPGEKRFIKISFLPLSSSVVTDTILFGDACVQQKVLVLGSGGEPDFYVTDYDWGKRPVGNTVLAPSPIALGGVLVVNPTKQPLSIDTIRIDSAQFVVTEPLPLAVPASGSVPVHITFTANYTGKQVISNGHFHGMVQDGAKLGWRGDTVKGEGIAPAQVFRSDTAVDLRCPTGDTVHLAFYVQATGDVSTQVVKLEHSQASDPRWTNLQAMDQSYRPLDPNTNPVSLSNGMRMLVYLDFVPPTNQSGVFTDNITAYTKDAQGNLVVIKTITATVTLHYLELTTSNDSLYFGTQVYGSPLTATQSIQVKNTSTEDVNFDKIIIAPGSKNPASFQIVGYTLNGTATTLPVILHPNDVLLVNVAFDPSVSLDQLQSATLVALHDACLPTRFMPVVANVKSGGAYIQGYNSSPVLACANEQGTVIVGNPQAPAAVETITGTQITGPNAANFAIPNVIGTQIAGQATTNIPVTFSPNPVAGSVPYNATLTVYLEGPLSFDTVSTPLNGTGVSIAATTTASLQTKSEAADNHVTMPIALDVNMGGLPTPLETMRINAVRLTFGFNTDLLSIEGSDPNSAAVTGQKIVNAIKNVPAGWAVDPNGSSLVNGKLVVLLRNAGGYLSAGTKSFGDVTFKITLPGVDTTRNVALNSMELFADDGQGNLIPVEAGCVATTVKSTDFTLVYQCGDSTLQQIMNGNRAFLSVIRPASPSPAANAVTFHYGMSVEQPITLAIYDVLGNQVATVLDRTTQSPGTYDVTYDVTKLPSGTYTYRLQGRDAVQSRQFVVSR